MRCRLSIIWNSGNRYDGWKMAKKSVQNHPIIRSCRRGQCANYELRIRRKKIPPSIQYYPLETNTNDLQQLKLRVGKIGHLGVSGIPYFLTMSRRYVKSSSKFQTNFKNFLLENLKYFENVSTILIFRKFLENRDILKIAGSWKYSKISIYWNFLENLTIWKLFLKMWQFGKSHIFNNQKSWNIMIVWLIKNMRVSKFSNFTYTI
mgnify:CR=1 FL=1